MNSFKKLPVYVLFIGSLHYPALINTAWWRHVDDMFEEMEREMAASRQRMRALFNELEESAPMVKAAVPEVQIAEHNNAVIVTIPVGQVSSDDITVEVDNDVAMVRVPTATGRLELQMADSRLLLSIIHQAVKKEETATKSTGQADKDTGTVNVKEDVKKEPVVQSYASHTALSSQFYSLPARIDVNHLTAEYKEGQLILTVAQRTAKKIAVIRK